MSKKIVCAVVAILLVVAAVVLLPGGLARLQGGVVPPSPIVLPESTLTAAEIEIAADDVNPAWIAATAVRVTLEGERMSVQGVGATLSEDGRVLTIRQNGTYVFSGEMSDGQIVVDVAKGRVDLVFANADLCCRRSSPIYVRQASSVRVIAEAGTVNQLSDGTEYDYIDPVYLEPDATIFSEDDLILCGTGELTVEGNFRDAIHGKDTLIIADLALNIRAKEDGIIARDALLMRGATLEADCKRDCIKANNVEAGFGYIYIESGVYRLTAGTDAIQAAGRMLITGGEYHLLCGGGYVYPRGLESRKGLKATSELVVSGGSFEIDSSDDAIHADTRAALTGGSFSLYAGDDAILATDLYIGGGEITVRTCLEGMVAERMEIAGGKTSITSQMDGVNARIRALIVDESFDLYPDDAVVEAPSTAQMYITGGSLVVNADRDALCVRGSIQMSGGLALLAGPEFTGGDPLDCDGGFTMTGGTLVAVGRTTYVPALTEQSTAGVVEATFSEVRTADTPIALQQGAKTLITAVSPRAYYKMVIFSPLLQEGGAYALRAGGEVPSLDDRIFLGAGAVGGSTIGSFLMRDGFVSLTEGGKTFPDHYYEEEIL
ncbi:MAG: carbohydrate-binding domain-containing protein [Clostridia bacterium]|nr:carbohydrate-binding domain-containing protein [Clostridia bacterium]